MISGTCPVPLRFPVDEGIITTFSLFFLSSLPFTDGRQTVLSSYITAPLWQGVCTVITFSKSHHHHRDHPCSFSSLPARAGSNLFGAPED